MTPKLTRRQAIILGTVVLAGVVFAAMGLVAVAAKQNLFADTVEISTTLPEAHDVIPGTPVRIRGVDAGHVTSVQPDDDNGVTITMKVKRNLADRLASDANAKVYSTGMLGTKVIAIHPGTTAAGPMMGRSIKGEATIELSDAATKLSAVADEAGGLLKDARAGKGSIGKLLTDDGLYRDMTGLAQDARKAVGTVETQTEKVDRFVADGRETLRSVKQGSNAVQKMPIIRSYVENTTELLVRPTWRREEVTYKPTTLFEPGTAILTEAGKVHLNSVTAWLKAITNTKAEVVVVAKCSPGDATLAGADQLTKKQAEVVVEYLKEHNVHKMGTWKRRTLTAVGLGTDESPIRETEPMPSAFVQVNVYVPQ